MYYYYHENAIYDLIAKFKVLGRKQVEEFLRIISENENSNKALEYIITNSAPLSRNELIGYGIEADRKTIIAFWTFLSIYATHKEEIKENFAPAKYPGQIVFTTASEVYVILVVDNAVKDKELITLNAMKETNVKYIIVGANLKREEIKPELLPTSDYVFCEYTLTHPVEPPHSLTFSETI